MGITYFKKVQEIKQVLTFNIISSVGDKTFLKARQKNVNIHEIFIAHYRVLNITHTVFLFFITSY